MATWEEVIKKHQDFSGITNWVENGVTGKGIVVWNAEGAGGSHAIATAKRITDGAPECTVVSGGLNSRYSNGELTVTVRDGDFAGTPDEYIELQKVDIVTISIKGASKDSGRYQAYEEYWAGVQKRHPNVVFFTAAANDGEEDTCGGFPANVAYYVGACSLRNGKPVRDGYSNYGEDLDFMNLTGPQGGTSFSSPYTAGMAALLKQLAPMNHVEVYEFLRMICEDMDEPGLDIKTGWGIPRLPDLETMRYITMKIGEQDYYVNGAKYCMDTAPMLLNGRTFVPLVFVGTSLGADVRWDNATRQVTVKDGKTKIVLTIGSNVMVVDGKKVYMDCAPFIHDSRTFVPIRWVAENLGAQVGWIQDEAKVMILKEGVRS